MKLGQAIQQAQAQGLDTLDAQLLLLHALQPEQHGRAWLLAHDQDPLPSLQQAAFHAAVARRSAGEPLAYITGHREFYGMDLLVDPRVLVPRPDTETLVDWALERLSGLVSPKVLDLGTGSGAIALAIQRAMPQAQVSAVDCSTDALAVAQENAARLGLAVQFVQSSWLSQVQGQFHLIVSNPPYIAEEDVHLAALKHEPIGALTAGPDGLDDIRQLVAQAPAHLLPTGWLLLEHGYDQAQAVRSMMESPGYQLAQSRRDLAGVERCSGAQRV